MKTALKDSILLPCLLVSGICTGILIHKHMSSSPAQAKASLPDDQQKKIKAMEKRILSLTNKIDALKEPVKEKAPPADAPLARSVSSMTPKREKVWVIGESEAADSSDLSYALSHLKEDERIELEKGFYELDLTKSSSRNIQIKGSSNSNIIYKHSADLHSVQKLALENVDITFSDHMLDFIGMGFGDMDVSITQASIKHPKMTLSFRENSRLRLERVELSGVGLRFSGNSSATVLDSRLSKSQTLITLADSATLDVQDSIFADFDNVAMTSDSDDTRLKAKGISVFRGLYAFWGKFNQANARILESKFHHLQEFTLTGTTVNCTTCEKYDIKR